MGQTLPFAKYEGIGNDFVIVDTRTADLALAAELAVAICDRHRGVGADGVLLVDSEPGSLRMRVINADGSRPEMCGNGIRCVALYLVQSGAVRDAELEIATDAGPHRCRVTTQPGQRGGLVEVTMRAASLRPAEVPVREAQAPVLDQPFEVGSARVRLSCVSMGNPHGVTFDDVGAARSSLGPALEKHARFPHGANIGFARMLTDDQIELAVWERGVGFTEACGTGACAAAVAAVETGRAARNRPIEVRLPGGTLVIRVPEAGEGVQMTGPARKIFSGLFEA
jgi:diaminopimelate epimerase